MKKRTVRHIGLHSERTFSPHNYPEAIYAAEWKKENTSRRNAAILHHLLAYGENTPGPELLSARDAEVAATVIQWLGSGIGQEFISKCQEKIARVRNAAE